jgi:hypothetical protein
MASGRSGFTLIEMAIVIVGIIISIVASVLPSLNASSCTGPSPLTISTTSIPGGAMNSTYMTTFNASGGTTPYAWSLTANGGFSDFSINPSTGIFNGGRLESVR